MLSEAIEFDIKGNDLIPAIPKIVITKSEYSELWKFVINIIKNIIIAPKTNSMKSRKESFVVLYLIWPLAISVEDLFIALKKYPVLFKILISLSPDKPSFKFLNIFSTLRFTLNPKDLNFLDKKNLCNVNK